MRRLLPSTFILLFLLVACQKQGVFRPNTISLTPVNTVILGEPILVTFTQLAENLERYQNVLIRVTGDYQPLAQPNCVPERGPRTRWSLVSENKQMRILGLEEVVVPLAWEGLNMTLDGVWRKYEGPLGCGKNATPGTTWYLEIAQIVQPNPIPDFFLNGQPTPDANATLPADGGPETPPLPDGTTPTPPDGSPGYPPPGETPTPPTLIASATPRPSPSVTPTIAVSASPTASATASATGTASQTVTATIPTGSSTTTPTPTPTPGPGTPSVTPLPTSLPGPTSTGYPPPPY